MTTDLDTGFAGDVERHGVTRTGTTWRRAWTAALVGSRYHGERRRFLDGCDRALAFAMAAAGTACAILAMAGTTGLALPACALATTVLAAARMGLRLDRRASEEDGYRRRFADLAGRLAGSRDATEDRIEALEAERVTLEAETAPRYRTLAELCEAEVRASLAGHRPERPRPKLWRRALRHVRS